MNAKKELLDKMEHIDKWLGGTKIVCATIHIDPYGYYDEDEQPSKPHILKQGHTPEELTKFLNGLDFNYNSGYGTQELFGTVWFTNGIWMDRYEYDGSESWDIHKYPAIPYDLQSN
jgi:hypothetical protein